MFKDALESTFGHESKFVDIYNKQESYISQTTGPREQGGVRMNNPLSRMYKWRATFIIRAARLESKAKRFSKAKRIQGVLWRVQST